MTRGRDFTMRIWQIAPARPTGALEPPAIEHERAVYAVAYNGTEIDHRQGVTRRGKVPEIGGTRGAAGSDTYLELVRGFPLRPIRSEKDLQRAISVINSLIDRDALSPDEEDYLDVLGDLVKKYETEHHPQPPVSDAEMLRHLIEARGTTQAQVAAATGIAESTISAILAGKRGMTRKHIESLARYFKVKPAVFISS